MLNHIKAYCLGVRDGWQQPFEASSTLNVEHLGDVQESFDRGLNHGQFLHAGTASQPVREGWIKIPRLFKRGR